jgi:hypothetical protein
MSGDSVAIDALLFVALVAPIAVYFLFLGLVNSHSRPCRVSSRADFTSLTIVMLPLLVAPIPALARASLWWLLGLEVGLAAWAFFALLPRGGDGWVIYNISAPRCRAVIEAAMADAGWAGRWNGDTWRGDAGALHLTSVPLLRNVTIHLELSGGTGDGRVAAFDRALERRLMRIEQLPSTTGACLLLVGVALLALPIWMMGRHIQDVVEAMVHLFS